MSETQSKKPQIDLRRKLRHPGEIPWLVVGGVIALVAYVITIVVLISASTSNDPEVTKNGTLMQLVVLVMVSPLLILFSRGLLYGQLRTSAVRMTPTQFPQGYRMVVEAARAAGLRRVPDAYVQSGSGQINAFASGHGYRRFVVVYSDLFEVGGAARDPDALRFVIGHEVGHLAAGHASYWRIVVMQVISQIPVLGQFLSRAQEYTADNYGFNYRPEGAAGAMAVLSGGKYLNVDVNIHEFADRSNYESGLFVWCANLAASHPVLTWRAQALRDRRTPGRLFLKPRFAPYGAPALPPGQDRTTRYPTPDEALAYLDAFPPLGPPQFGRNFPVPLPGSGLDPNLSDYGERTLYAGWQGSQPPPAPGDSHPQ